MKFGPALSGDDLRDVLVFGGITLASIGVGCYQWQAGLIVFGCAMAAIGLKFK